MKKKYIIYKLINTNTGLPFYIGMTTQSLQRRLSNHLSKARRGKTNSSAWDEIRRIGDSNVGIKFIKEVFATKSVGFLEEKRITKEYKDKYGDNIVNINLGSSNSVRMIQNNKESQKTSKKILVITPNGKKKVYSSMREVTSLTGWSRGGVKSSLINKKACTRGEYKGYTALLV